MKGVSESLFSLRVIQRIPFYPVSLLARFRVGRPQTLRCSDARRTVMCHELTTERGANDKCDQPNSDTRPADDGQLRGYATAGGGVAPPSPCCPRTRRWPHRWQRSAWRATPQRRRRGRRRRHPDGGRRPNPPQPQTVHAGALTQTQCDASRSQARTRGVGRGIATAHRIAATDVVGGTDSVPASCLVAPIGRGIVATHGEAGRPWDRCRTCDGRWPWDR